MTSTGFSAAVDVVAMGPDCTIRSIDAAYRAIRLIQPADGTVQVDCGGVEQADITFVQLIVSAQATLAAQGVRLVIDPVSACIHAAFGRSGIPLPGAERQLPS